MNLPPINMAHIENIFSGLVLAETLPKPTLVRLLQVKYRAARYDVRMSGLLVLFSYIGLSSLSLSSNNQPVDKQQPNLCLMIKYYYSGQFLGETKSVELLYFFCKYCVDMHSNSGLEVIRLFSCSAQMTMKD